VIKTIQYQLDLNKSQKALLSKFFGCTRFIYNYMLNKKIEVYKKDKTSLSYIYLSKELTQLKKQPKYIWLNEVANVSLQQSLRNLDAAYERFFKLKTGFPKFKSKDSKQSCKFTENVHISDKKIKLPKIGWVRIYMDKDLPEGKIGTVTVSKNTANKYFVSIIIKNDDTMPVKCPVTIETTIGIDVGITSFAILSDGTKIKNPKYLEKAETRLNVLQRRLARKQKGCNRRKAARLRVAKYHYKISCKRNDFLHKLSSKIISENQTIVIEDLNIKGMIKNHKLAKAIASVSWSEFFRQLKYKAEYSGKNIIQIGQFEPSSKLCNVCNHKHETMKLSNRHWTCLNCGTYHDRDINASINIKNIGLKNSREAIPGEDVELPTIVGVKKRQDKKFAKAN